LNKKDLFEFPLKSAYSPNGDQPYAIDQLTEGIMGNKKIDSDFAWGYW
jgi:excinuclease UvrABC helicase subunit UvrB